MNAMTSLHTGLQKMSQKLCSRLSINESLQALACSNPGLLARNKSVRRQRKHGYENYLKTLEQKAKVGAIRSGILQIATHLYEIFLTLQRVDPSTRGRAFYDQGALSAVQARTQVSCYPCIRASHLVSFFVTLQYLKYLGLSR